MAAPVDGAVQPLSRLLFIRHGRTAWNAEKRIQGHTDIALDEVGRSELEGKRLPRGFAGWPVFSSPLVRAVETARLLGLSSLRTDERLREMSYGEWEGFTWSELRARHGDNLAARERLGLDFRPDGGESPRELRTRLLDWVADVACDSAPAVAVTHKGVIRMALAIATGWDLVSRAPYRLVWNCAHEFDITPNSPGLRVNRMNLPLEADP